MDEEKCFLEFRPDPKRGWVYVRGKGCENAFAKIYEYLGPHGKRYLDGKDVTDEGDEAESSE